MIDTWQEALAADTQSAREAVEYHARVLKEARAAGLPHVVDSAERCLARALETLARLEACQKGDDSAIIDALDRQ